MALSHSPRRLVPLASGDERPSRFKSSHQPTLTRRVFFCGVVVENTEHGHELPHDVQDLVASLGDPVDLEPEAGSATDLTQASNEPYKRKRATTFTSTNDSPSSSNGPYTRKRSNTVTTALTDIINELVATERSYVKRLRTLKSEYADPLRTFSKNKDTAIIPPYEAKTLFGNIDQLLPVNEAFLEDLEKMTAPDGPETVGGVGDVALKHFKELKGFEQYKQYYSKREEAQQIFERELRHSSFSSFIDRIKYASGDVRNRVGLRELLMEPIQRIPRYTLMFRIMIKHMSPHDPQRAKLIEADEIASKIALAETDEQTKRAAIMHCFSSTVDDFPPNLISHSRKFIDCIDVEDVLAPSPDGHSALSGASAPGSAPGSSLHCTLFLFDDKLVIVKRPGDKNGRSMTGLDDLDKVVKGKGMAAQKKNGLVCKGVMEVVDVVATDIGGADFHLYLETPPQDLTDRWNGRPFRALSVVFPPSPINLDPTRSEIEKRRFLENLWAVQARYRTRLGQSVILSAEEREVENRGGKVTTARAYFNLYQRTAYMRERAKMKVVVHIDPTGSADPIPFGSPGGPFVVIRVQPMPGELSRYIVQSSDANDEGEEDILHTARVPARIVQTIHQYGLFKFRTGNQSAPSTPTVNRTRAGIFGLDAISRNLFHARAGSSKETIFGGSINTHKRSKTVASRSSTYTQSTVTADSSVSRMSSRSRGSTITAATSFDDDRESFSGSASADTGSASSRRSQSLTKAKKLIKKKRPKSPGGSGSEPEASPARSMSRCRSPSSDWYTDNEEQEERAAVESHPQDQSERDLFARLELARQNSRSQQDAQFHEDILEGEEDPMEDMYEDEPPQPLRPLSRASRASTRDLPEIPGESRPSSAMSRPYTPQFDDGERITRPLSVASEHRPRGPRSPSPLPSSRTPEIRIHDLPSEEDVTVMEDTIVHDLSRLTMTTPKQKGKSPPSQLPRSKRQPFDTPRYIDGSPIGSGSGAEAAKLVSSVEPLSIRRKPSSTTLNSHKKRVYAVGRGSPVARPAGRVSSNSLSRRTSSQLRPHLHVPANMVIEDAKLLVSRTESAKQGIESARRSVRQIREQYEHLAMASPSSSSASNITVRAVTPQPEDRPMSPVKNFRSSTRNTPPPVVRVRPSNSPFRQLTPEPQTKEAKDRMEEMQRLIGRRAAENSGRPRPLSMVTEPVLPTKYPEAAARAEEVARTMDELASHVDTDLGKAAQSLELVHGDLQRLTATLVERTEELEKSRNDVANAKLQIAFIKQLYDDSTAEKDALYDAFNEELDSMFNDASLPEDEAWAALARDLTAAKKARNETERLNLQLRRDLAEMEIQKESYAALLRANGLIP